MYMQVKGKNLFCKHNSKYMFFCDSFLTSWATVSLEIIIAVAVQFVVIVTWAGGRCEAFTTIIACLFVGFVIVTFISLCTIIPKKIIINCICSFNQSLLFVCLFALFSLFDNKGNVSCMRLGIERERERVGESL